MLIIISGPSCVGKSFTVRHLCAEYGFFTITPYTTRKPRASEAEGIHYAFRSEKEISDLSSNLTQGYWSRPLGRDLYGYTEHVDALAKDDRNCVIQAYSDMALDIKHINPDAHIVFLDFKTDAALTERIAERFGSDPEELAARISHAKHERGRKAQFDYFIESNNHEIIAREVAAYALTKATHSPFNYAFPPGPLSDADVRDLLLDKKGLRIAGLGERTLQPRGWSIDLTLSPKYYRVKPHRVLRRVFDLVSGTEHDMAKRFVETVAVDHEGIRLRPYEFILGSTQEKLTLPSNIVGLVSGRSSYARMGISIDLSQIFIQPGHDDTIPLQIQNNLPYPVVIYPKAAVAQVVFFRTVSASSTPYFTNPSAKYVGRLADIRSRYYEDPIYGLVKEAKPPKRRIDWGQNLNVILFLLAFAFAMAWLVSVVADPATSRAAKMIQVIIFILTAIMALLRLLVLLVNRS